MNRGSWWERAATSLPPSVRARVSEVRERMLWGAHRQARVPEMAALSDPEHFRKTMGLFPSLVSVVTALDATGAPRGLTCSAACALSMDPPSMLICVNRRNGSLEAIRHSGGFVVNLLRSGRDRLSNVFASGSGSKFASVDWQRSPGTGLPVLTSDALAVVECGLQAEIVAGSHVIVIGLVRNAKPMTPESAPLVYWCRCYGTWTSSAPSASWTAQDAPDPTAAPESGPAARR